MYRENFFAESFANVSDMKAARQTSACWKRAECTVQITLFCSLQSHTQPPYSFVWDIANPLFILLISPRKSSNLKRDLLQRQWACSLAATCTVAVVFGCNVKKMPLSEVGLSRVTNGESIVGRRANIFSHS